MSYQFKKHPVHEVADQIFCIQTVLPGTTLGTINAYLIRGKERSILIDTAYRTRHCIRNLTDSLAFLGVVPEQMDIVLTHFHNDHSGASTDLIHPERTIYVPKDEFTFFGIYKQESYYNESRRALYTKEGLTNAEFDTIMHMKNSASMCFPDFHSKQFTPICAHDILTVGDYSLEAIHTPGHTPGHMCYYDRQKKIIFTGDHVLFDITPNIIPWDTIPNNLGIYLNSLSQAKELDVEIALPGHRFSGNYYSRIDELIAHHKKRLAECEALVKNKPGRTAFQLTGSLSWNLRNNSGKKRIPDHLIRYAFGECLSHLQALSMTGRVKHRLCGDFYRYY